MSERIGEILDKVYMVEWKIREIKNCMSVLERAVETIIKLYNGVKKVSINLLTEKEMEKELKDTFEFLDNNYFKLAEQCCNLMTVNVRWLLAEVEDELYKIRKLLFAEIKSESESEKVNEQA